MSDIHQDPDSDLTLSVHPDSKLCRLCETCLFNFELHNAVDRGFEHGMDSFEFSYHHQSLQPGCPWCSIIDTCAEIRLSLVQGQHMEHSGFPLLKATPIQPDPDDIYVKVRSVEGTISQRETAS